MKNEEHRPTAVNRCQQRYVDIHTSREGLQDLIRRRIKRYIARERTRTPEGTMVETTLTRTAIGTDNGRDGAGGGHRSLTKWCRECARLRNCC